MIKLEDAHLPGRLQSVSEGVETGAQHQDLPHAVRYRFARRILGEAAAHGDEQTQRPPLRPLPGERDGAFGVWPEDRKRERIGEDEAPLEDLMRRPMSRRAKRGHARLSLSHGRESIGATSRLSSATSLTPKIRSPIDRASLSQAMRRAGRLLTGRPAFIFAE